METRERLWFSGSECVYTHTDIAPVGFTGLGPSRGDSPDLGTGTIPGEEKQVELKVTLSQETLGPCLALISLCPQVSRSGQNNSVFTLYELTSGEDTEEEGNAFFFFQFSHQNPLFLQCLVY